MRSALICTMLLQAVCNLLWLKHSSFLANEYSELEFRRGVEMGRSKMSDELAARKIDVPSDLEQGVDKDLVVGRKLSRDFHNMIIFWPACFLQGGVLFMLGVVAVVYRRFDREWGRESRTRSRMSNPPPLCS